MDFGINLATAADSWKVVKRAEALGYARAWFYDTQVLNADMFVAMGAAAVQTSRIGLGTGVLIPSNRIAPVAASALGSLNALAPGRIDFGISTGFTARRTMGLGPVKLDDMVEYIRIVQRLLAGDTIEWTFEGKTRKSRFLDPEVGAVNVNDPIPLFISALGPRGRKLTAQLGAHWIRRLQSLRDPHRPRSSGDAGAVGRRLRESLGGSHESCRVPWTAEAADDRDRRHRHAPRARGAGPHGGLRRLPQRSALRRRLLSIPHAGHPRARGGRHRGGRRPAGVGIRAR
jgi:alkanesulfonate monooxygenase SsuD/methylene tetrahydromethanopterin reductase-like flavin-dependent oxidoreductase (luciferase family)